MSFLMLDVQWTHRPTSVSVGDRICFLQSASSFSVSCGHPGHSFPGSFVCHGEDGWIPKSGFSDIRCTSEGGCDNQTCCNCNRKKEKRERWNFGSPCIPISFFRARQMSIPSFVRSRSVLNGLVGPFPRKSRCGRRGLSEFGNYKRKY